MKSHTLWLLACVLSAANSVSAQTTSDDTSRAVARDLGTEGIDAYRAGDYANADKKLERAYRLFAAPTLGLWSARTRAQLGHWIEAAERYRDAMRTTAVIGDSDAQRQAQADAQKELELLLPRIPTLTLQLENAEPSEVQVSLDGVALPSELIGIACPSNVGKHNVVAVRGDVRLELSVQLTEKEKKQLPLRFEPKIPQLSTAPVAASPQPAAAELRVTETQLAPATSSPASALKPIAISAFVLSAAGLATWGIGALLANGKLDECSQSKGEHWCNTQQKVQTYNTWKTLSTVGFYAGTSFAVIGLGASIWAAQAHEKATPQVTWRVGPTSVSLRGTF